MTIKADKNYKVEKYTKEIFDLGILPGTDVKRILKGYEEDELLGMWFSPKCKVAYTVEEI